ncbi:hypothetical protein FZC66_02175 [Priestia megaterium]|nr:hypothetical protein FZC66_02175 [Priestia megaterium]
MKYKQMWVLLLCMMLISCQHSKEEISLQTQKQNNEEQQIKPLTIKGASFYSVADWFDNERVLVIEKQDQQFQLYTYNIYTSEKELFYSSKHQIVSVKPSPDYHYFLIHTALSDEKAELVFLDKSGKEIYTLEMNSYDLHFAWNSFMPNELLITNFSRNWTFSTSRVNVEKGTVTSLLLSQPFAYWVGKNEVAYLNTSNESQEFVASSPLIIENIDNKQKQQVTSNVSVLKNIQSMFFVLKGNNEMGEYTFYKKNHRQPHTFRTRMLSSYGGPFVPYYQLDESKQMFYTYVPQQTGEMDSYKGKFDFIEFSLETGETNTVMEDVENVPIKLSPNGKLSLMGYQFERIFTFNQNKVNTLVRIL